MVSINEPLIETKDNNFAVSESLPDRVRRVHIIGAGPVGILLAALLQSMAGVSVRLYEKRPAYTRTRMVKLASYLVADSLESYRVDPIDGESITAIFDDEELEQGLAFRQAIPPESRSAIMSSWEYMTVPFVA
jgi:NADPH-dependent 2,4-dienoyl-CoA reductase/sulfur reductase-like enzyme